ncbi:TMEM43 family protein [Lysobacter niastensis]|uniref:Uncharacterized protein n=1 Tax=Lysobacter niastensis TaxID=380629 RepID=A0ABS0B2W7_9GAMM|nr:TMEM43 family protein [Lysobacter niastensis]MBF6022820.1 hypothetical protein [Lysobacter niastensis]
MIHRRARTALASLLLALAMPVIAQPASQPVPSAPVEDPVPGELLRDRDFGVVSRQFGLDRQVEMYQWRAEGDVYARVWNAAPIDSSGFAPGHENPKRIPLESRRWWSDSATLDGRPLDTAVLQALGEWQVFRPGFSRLPANLAASFQPEGDGLGSAENPLDPQIGDLRVRWRELRLPPLAGSVEWRDGSWRLRPDALQPRRNEVEDAELMPDGSGALSRTTVWLVAGLIVLVVGFVVLRRRRRARGNG